MKCQQCGCENNDGALFCAECGKALSEQPIALDLQQIKIPASARKARIVKVNAKKSEAAPEAEAQTLPQAHSESADKLTDATQQQVTADKENAADTLIDFNEPQAQSAPVQPAAPLADDPTLAPMKKRNWLAVFILCAIPCVNLIMLLIWSFSPRTNKSKKSYAQMSLILMLIGILLLAAIAFVAVFVFNIDITQLINYIPLR